MFAKQSDAEIQQAVLRELKWDTRVEETNVGVEVNNGIVTLTGRVSSLGKRIAAERAAHRVAGVLDVADDLEVHIPGGTQRTDTEIAQAVRHALEWDSFVPAARIRSTVSDGWVTLEGDVDSWSQRDDAEKAVRNLRGVRGLSTHIDIRPPVLGQAELHRAIDEALTRQAVREAQRIQLETRDGNVTIRGVVRTLAEKDAVIGAVKGTLGVRSVDAHLRIEARS